MAGGIVRTEAQRLMASSFDGPPWLALLAVAGSATAGGTEVSGGPGPYGRQQAAFDTTSTPGTAQNSGALNFTGLPAGNVVQVATFTTQTGGTRRWFADLGVTRTVADGDAISFAAGSCVFQLQ